MRLHIEHNTTYRYSWPVLYSIQHVRLTPAQNAHQQVLDWKINTPARQHAAADHFGNVVTSFSVNQPHRELLVRSSGTVEIHAPIDGYQTETDTAVNPLVYASPTKLTQYNEEMKAFGSLVVDKHIPFTHRLLSLAHAVADRVSYTKGSTSVADSAMQAFDNGQGVCQDHAHVMLACLRAHGMAARYVSGYFFDPKAETHDSHAWVEVFNPERGQWLGIDATHRSVVAGQHCKLAVAKDFTGASPVRGIRSGGGQECLEVHIEIQALD